MKSPCSFGGVLILLLCPLLLSAQSSLNLRNNTWQDLEVQVYQTGSHTLDPVEWSQKETLVNPWLKDIELMETDRTAAAIPLGDSVFFDVQLISAADTLHLWLRLKGVSGGSTLDYSLSGNGFQEPWHNNGGFHQVTTPLAGTDLVIQYTPDNGDANPSRDITFQLHQTPLYTLDSTDYADPQVLNVMAYNIQMLPFGISGMGQANDRADHFPAWLSLWQDVVIFAEAFDGTARSSHLEPAMAAAGFPYKTDVLNDYFPFNGGIIIFSRWPIETTDMYDFELCGPNSADCFANKGILYARVNKLGKKYHVFGTHMDAGSAPADLEAKNLQMAEMRDFIAAQNIPDNEAVVYGGDFNVGPLHANNLYANMHDSLDPIVIPRHNGFWESTFSLDTAAIIDHVWGCGSHLIPLGATNTIITPRPLDTDLWDLGEFSDHRAVLGHFVYPEVFSANKDTSLCPGDNYTLSVSASNAVTYQWHKNGQPLSGETNATLMLNNAQVPDAGQYECQVQYSRIFGDDGHFITPFFFPDGPDTLLANLMVNAGVVDLNCGVGRREEIEPQPDWRIYPNPLNQPATLNLEMDLPAATRLKGELWDVQGRLCNQFETALPQGPSVHKLDLSQLVPGLYNLVLQLDEKQFYKKVVIF